MTHVFYEDIKNEVEEGLCGINGVNDVNIHRKNRENAANSAQVGSKMRKMREDIVRLLPGAARETISATLRRQNIRNYKMTLQKVLVAQTE